MRYGFIPDEIKKEDFVLGASNQLGGEVLQPDGQWDNFLPSLEIQNISVETYACVSFTTLNCVEILSNRLYGQHKNWSDRFLASISGTKAFRGNTPHGVAEPLRKKGTVQETDYPFNATTYDDYYKVVPQPLYTLALQFTAEYSFGHEYVSSNAEAIKEALKYSPVGFSVYAWSIGSDGLYSRPFGLSDTHFCVCYGYVEGQYWKIFDSYSQDGSVIKKVAWHSIPQQAKRYTLTRQIVVESAWSRFVELLREIFNSYGRMIRGLFDPGSLGAQRSPKWRQLRNSFIKQNPACAVCSTKDDVEAHHIVPVNVDSSKELQISNLITLCTRDHLLFGHLGSFRSWNENVSEDADLWRDKIKSRP